MRDYELEMLCGEQSWMLAEGMPRLPFVSRTFLELSLVHLSSRARTVSKCARTAACRACDGLKGVARMGSFRMDVDPSMNDGR